MAAFDISLRPDNAEKSQTSAHSFNYKLGEMLKKEVQSLNREEKNSACSITIEQRIITTRFRNKLIRSVELMKYHEKLKSRFHHVQEHQIPREMYSNDSIESSDLRQSEKQRPIKEANKEAMHGFDRKFSIKSFTGLRESSTRSQTPVELKSKLWKKRAETAKERVVRAKSAPPQSWCTREDIIKTLDCGGGGFYGNRSKKRPLSRAKFHEVFDSNRYNAFREIELEQQANDVKSFIQSIEPLTLVPWYPGAAKKVDDKQVSANARTKKPKRSGFITRTDSVEISHSKYL